MHNCFQDWNVLDSCLAVILYVVLAQADQVPENTVYLLGFAFLFSDMTDHQLFIGQNYNHMFSRFFIFVAHGDAVGSRDHM
jgi:hypothetical protein